MLAIGIKYLKQTINFVAFFEFLIVAGEKYNCSSSTNIYLNLNEIIFFESTNYPKLLTMAETLSCNLTFSLKGSYSKVSEEINSCFEK